MGNAQLTHLQNDADNSIQVAEFNHKLVNDTLSTIKARVNALEVNKLKPHLTLINHLDEYILYSYMNRLSSAPMPWLLITIKSVIGTILTGLLES